LSEASTTRRAKWDDRYAAKDLVWSAAPNERFAAEVNGLNPGRALDIACGEGRNALWLAEQGWDVTAIDFSQVAIDKGCRIAAKRQVTVNWLCENVSTYVLPEGEFDLVSLLYMHTDAAERQKWLANTLAAVKSGGTFIYIGHDPSNIGEGSGGPQDPQYLPTAEELVSAMDGFSVQFAGVIERTVASDPGHANETEGTALDTLVRLLRD
jgi:SAM-dependent methyltransferase